MKDNTLKIFYVAVTLANLLGKAFLRIDWVPLCDAKNKVFLANLKFPIRQAGLWSKYNLILLSKSGHQESEEYNHFWRCSVWERSADNIRKSLKLKQSGGLSE